MTYGEAVNADEMSAGRYLPEGLVEGCMLKRDDRRRTRSSPTTTWTCRRTDWPIGCAPSSTVTSAAKRWLDDVVAEAQQRAAGVTA